MKHIRDRPASMLAAGPKKKEGEADKPSLPEPRTISWTGGRVCADDYIFTRKDR